MNEYSGKLSWWKGATVTVGGVTLGSALLWAWGIIRAHFGQYIPWPPAEDVYAFVLLVAGGGGAFRTVQDWAKHSDSTASNVAQSIMGIVKLVEQPKE